MVQTDVDHQYLFRDVNIGWPGGVNDGRILANAELYKKATNNLILYSSSCNVPGTNIYTPFPNW